MNILKKIIKHKRNELFFKKKLISIEDFESFKLFDMKTLSLKNSINCSDYGIIAEFKRRSPSISNINQHSNVQDVAIGYMNAGASGISTLTDQKYFGGSIEDLLLAKSSSNIPILRKDFIVDEYQIYEAKAYGADVILLIAAILSVKKLKNLSQKAKELKLEVLLEVHSIEEINLYSNDNIDIIGVNNRDLKTFTTSLDVSKKLISHIPDNFIKISESGISRINSINELKEVGYNGFLIGEMFMKNQNPSEEACNFINSLKKQHED